MEKREIENQLKELQKQLNSLKTEIADKEEKDDIYPLIQELEDNATKLKVELYRKITPLERVQIARHPNRPTTMDYIKYLIKDFIQFHGDRRYMDDHAIIAGIAFLKEYRSL